MKTLLIASLLLSFSVPAFAGAAPKTPRFYSFTVDNRPADGNFERIALLKDENGNFMAKYQVVTAGFGFPVQNTVEDLGRDLICEETIENRKLVKLFCAVDMRPADGALTELTFVRDESGTYEATLRTALYGTLISSEFDETKHLAAGLLLTARK